MPWRVCPCARPRACIRRGRLRLFPSRLARWMLRGPGDLRRRQVGRLGRKPVPREAALPSLIRSRGERHPVVSVPRGRANRPQFAPLLARGRARVRSGGYEVLRSEWRPRRNGRKSPRPPTSLSPSNQRSASGAHFALCAVRQLGAPRRATRARARSATRAPARHRQYQGPRSRHGQRAASPAQEAQAPVGVTDPIGARGGVGRGGRGPRPSLRA
jgi:hypothetical protein